MTYLNGLPCEFFEYYNEHHGLNKAESFLILFSKFYIVDDDIVKLTNTSNKIVYRGWECLDGDGRDAFFGTRFTHISDEDVDVEEEFTDIINYIKGLIGDVDAFNELLDMFLDSAVLDSVGEIADGFSQYLDMTSKTTELIKFLIYTSTGEIKMFLSYVFSIWEILSDLFGSLGGLIEDLFEDILPVELGGADATVSNWKKYRDIYPLGAVEITSTIVTVARLAPDLIGFIPVVGTILKPIINAVISGFTFELTNN